MHRRASHAILMHRREFSTSRRKCVASQRVAGPIGTMSHGDFKKWPCRSVQFKVQSPCVRAACVYTTCWRCVLPARILCFGNHKLERREWPARGSMQRVACQMQHVAAASFCSSELYTLGRRLVGERQNLG